MCSGVDGKHGQGSHAWMGGRSDLACGLEMASPVDLFKKSG
jgi:hypothetical protein